MRKLGLGLVLALAGCAGCTNAIYVAPIIPRPLPGTELAMTVCSWNNLPVIFGDTAIMGTADEEIVMEHERVHARRMKAYRGGCWPYLYRYNKDRQFKIREEMAAYCAEGRFAMARNRNPEALWQRIQGIMAQRYDTVLTSRHNCLYEE